MNLDNITIQLAKKSDIEHIIEIIKERCLWFKENNIIQWDEDYYTKIYPKDYFYKMQQKSLLYVAKFENNIVGLFLLKEEDNKYWNNDKKAYYIHHLITKVGYNNLGYKILKYIEQLAQRNNIHFLRLDCSKENKKLNEYYKNKGFICKGENEYPYPHKLWEKKVD